MEQKKIGVALLIFSLLLLASFLFYDRKVESVFNIAIDFDPNGACLHDEGKPCPHKAWSELSPHYYGQITLIALLLIFSLFLIFYTPAVQIIKEEKKTFKKPKDLDEEEQKIYDLLAESQGSLFQSDIVKKTEWSKVKITRVLDKLEFKGLIERRRRGMTNIIVLK